MLAAQLKTLASTKPSKPTLSPWCMCAQSLQSCLTLFDPMDCSPPGFSTHGISQARILEWVAMSSSRGSSWPRDPARISYVSCIDRQVLNHQLLLLLLSHVSCVRLCATPEMAAHQAPLSLGFSRQEHWSGLPFPFPTHESEKWKWSRSVMPDS